MNTITDLLGAEQDTNVHHLLALRHDAYMFHQANMRQVDVNLTTVNGEDQQLSLLQMWVENVVVELARLYVFILFFPRLTLC